MRSLEGEPRNILRRLVLCRERFDICFGQSNFVWESSVVIEGADEHAQRVSRRGSQLLRRLPEQFRLLLINSRGDLHCHDMLP